MHIMVLLQNRTTNLSRAVFNSWVKIRASLYIVYALILCNFGRLLIHAPEHAFLWMHTSRSSCAWRNFYIDVRYDGGLSTYNVTREHSPSRLHTFVTK